MAITYKKMWGLVHEKGLRWTDLRNDLGLSTKTVAKINKNEYVNLQTLDKISEYLECDIGDIVERIISKDE